MPTIAHTSRPRCSRNAFVVLLGALLVNACGNPPSPSPTASPPVSASPSTSTSSPVPNPTAAACVAADIRATGGPWGGAAGSRGSDIVVENRGSGPCLLPAGPAIALVDAGGTVVLSTPARAGEGPSVAPGGSVGFSLVFGNWCNEGTPLPLTFQLALAAGAVDIAGLAASSAGDLPPCNGPGLPPSLSATDWQP
ncbi:MAG: DUF4232 domain-containing protein [Chloroflexi bacterium]|nr:DUF4232 domain-containing protein [Chloroflexota bacterium]